MFFTHSKTQFKNKLASAQTISIAFQLRKMNWNSFYCIFVTFSPLKSFSHVLIATFYHLREYQEEICHHYHHVEYLLRTAKEKKSRLRVDFELDDDGNGNGVPTFLVWKFDFVEKRVQQANRKHSIFLVYTKNNKGDINAKNARNWNRKKAGSTAYL